MTRPTTVQGFVDDFITRTTSARPPDPSLRLMLENVMIAGVNAGLLLVTQRLVGLTQQQGQFVHIEGVVDGLQRELEEASQSMLMRLLDDLRAMEEGKGPCR